MKQVNAEKIFKGLIALFLVFVGIAFFITKKKIEEISRLANETPYSAPATQQVAEVAQAPRPRTTLPPPVELTELKQRTAKFAYQSFLETAGIAADLPFVIQSYAFDHRGPQLMIFQGSSGYGDKLVIMVQRGADEARLRGLYVNEQGFDERSIQVETRGRPTLYSLSAKGEWFLMRTSRTERDGAAVLMVWQKLRPHSIEDIGRF